jgi:hypothetical protein
MRETLLLYGDEQVLSELPLNVHPLRIALEARASGDFRWFVIPVLVTTLRPNGLIAEECEVCLFDVDSLGFHGAEMHLDSTLAGVVEGNMLKSG